MFSKDCFRYDSVSTLPILVFLMSLDGSRERITRFRMNRRGFGDR